MEQNKTIPDYVFDYLDNKATDQQKALTQSWLQQPENRLVFDQLKNIVRLSSDVKLFDKFDLQEGKIEITRKIRKANQTKRTFILQKIAAALLLPVLIISAWSFYQNNALKKEMAAIQITQEIKTQPGIRSSFLLPDGTKVWLNSASTVKFPSIFAGNTRTVELKGEAYFEVAKNKAKPFIVKSGAFSVTALGTAFNVCAYNDDNEISTTLAEGKVKISIGQHPENTYLLKPDEQLNFEKSTQKITKNMVNVYNVIAWRDGKLIFDETPFHEVVQKLGRWFNTDIKLADQSMDNYRYTATFTNENLAQVMELLSFSAPIEFTSTPREMKQGNKFGRKQIIIKAKPGAVLDQNTKNRAPMEH